jgi:YcxB-like protein
LAWSAHYVESQRQRQGWAGVLMPVLAIIGFLTAGALVAMALVWWRDPNRVPLGDALRFVPGILAQHLQAPLTIAVGCYAIYALLRRPLIARNLRGMAGKELGTSEKLTIAIDSPGIDYNTPHITTHLDWAGIQSIEQTRDHYFLAVQALRAFVIPKRDLTDDQRRLIDLWFTHHAHGGQTT